MQIPKKIKIGTSVIQVEKSEFLDDKYGAMEYRRQKIAIAHDLIFAQEVKVLLHEILHYIFYESGILDDFDAEAQERIVNTFTMPLIQVIRQNPEFIECIQQEEV